jgi:SHS2 domain-containing protein
MFETFEHTANLGPRVTGDSLNDVFAEAAVGLISLIVAKVDSVDASKRRMIELNSPNLEYL